MENKYALIMAGGVGSRFWPASTPEMPKQFLDFLGTGSTLIQLTFKRLIKFCPPENIFVATNTSYFDLVRQQLPEIPVKNILLEPARRNTARCIANAAYKISAVKPNSSLLVAPSDHVILNEDKFLTYVNQAVDFQAKNPSLITFGIEPTRPETGFGYLEFGSTTTENPSIYKLKSFTEKPSLPVAEKYLNNKSHFWNAGIFLFSVDLLVNEFKNHIPEIDNFYRPIAGFNTQDYLAEVNKHYHNLPSISIDYGIMEKAKEVYMLATKNMGWSDLGTWTGVGDNLSGDQNHNHIISGKVILQEVNNSLVMIPEHKKAVIRGLENFIIVDSGNALLIYPKDFEQEIKNVVEEGF